MLDAHGEWRPDGSCMEAGVTDLGGGLVGGDVVVGWLGGRATYM